jgi:hypothetical protein
MDIVRSPFTFECRKSFGTTSQVLGVEMAGFNRSAWTRSIARGLDLSKLKKLMQGIKGIYLGKGNSRIAADRCANVVIHIC